MNIEQIKQDFSTGVMPSRMTLVKLVDAALMMQGFIEEIGVTQHHYTATANTVLMEVEAM